MGRSVPFHRKLFIRRLLLLRQHAGHRRRPCHHSRNCAGKVFAAVIAFVSIGTVIFAAAFLLGPFLGKLIKIGEEKFKEEEKVVAGDLKRAEKEI